MRSIASSARRVTCGVFLATLFTLVGCGGTSLRRPLVTDQTPLGSTREDVMAWHRANGWCQIDFPPEVPRTHVAWLEPCGGPDRHRLSVLLAFSRYDEALVTAVVTVHVPPPAPRERLLPRTGGRFAANPPGELTQHRDHRDAAVNVMDALAAELEARYGAPDRETWTERAWVTRTELIQLQWSEPVEGLVIVSETHQPAAEL